MLESLPFSLLMGSALGFLSGLGVGGGSLLLLWLTLVLGIDYEIARNINLLFFLPCAVIACLFRWKQGMLDIRAVFPGIICGCISAACFSLLRDKLALSILKKLFGIILVAAGTRELLYKKKH